MYIYVVNIIHNKFVFKYVHTNMLQGNGFPISVKFNTMQMQVHNEKLINFKYLAYSIVLVVFQELQKLHWFLAQNFENVIPVLRQSTLVEMVFRNNILKSLFLLSSVSYFYINFVLTEVFMKNHFHSGKPTKGKQTITWLLQI